MSCSVLIYNEKFAPLAAPSILVIATKSNNKELKRDYSAHIGPEWGVNLNFAQQKMAYTITAHDTAPGTNYAPSEVTDLYGDIQGRLDIVMYPLPSGPTTSAPGPSTKQAIPSYIESQGWRPPEEFGVFSLVFAVMRSHIFHFSHMNDIYAVWHHRLHSLGIDPDIL